jgi:putative transcriptional regulator
MPKRIALGGILSVALVVFCLLALASPRAEEASEPGLRGRLLVAGPEMLDPNFSRSVVYMVEHEPSGAFGLVINRRFGEMSFAELAERLELETTARAGSFALHYGGPVEPQALFVLHNAEAGADDMPAGHGLTLSVNPAILGAIISENQAPERFLVALGYAGWGPRQLEGEIESGAWDIIDFDSELVFGGGAEVWERARALRSLDL